MPQITSCPECSKKLRVPDELIGKKVKCPGCTTMFVAEADDQDEEAPPPRKAPPKPPPSRDERERPRSDAVTSSPRGKRQEEDEEEEAPRSRGKRRDEEEEEEEAPRSRGRDRDRDEEEDRKPRRRSEEIEERRPRSRRDEEEDDRRPRRSRDEEDDEDDRRPRRGRDEDDDDDRPSRRRRDEDDEQDPSQGWQKVRTGTNFVAISGWSTLILIGLGILFAGIMLLMGGSAFGSMGGGNFGGAMQTGGSMMVLGCGFGLLFLLLGLTALILLMIGTGFCMATPRVRGQTMKGLAMTAFYLYIGAIAVYLFGIVVTSLMSLQAVILGVIIVYGGGLILFAGHIVWMVYLRQVCMYFRDTGLGRDVMTNLISLISLAVADFLIRILLNVINNYALSSALALITLIIGLLFNLALLCVFIWYVILLQKVRDLVEYKGT